MSVPASEATPIEQRIPAACATIQDYPHEGILFYDVTTLFANPEVFKACIDELAHRFEGEFDVVAGVEARGFLLASALAYATGKGIMTIRKAGKLPAKPTVRSTRSSTVPRPSRFTAATSRRVPEC